MDIAYFESEKNEEYDFDIAVSVYRVFGDKEQLSVYCLPELSGAVKDYDLQKNDITGLAGAVEKCGRYSSVEVNILYRYVRSERREVPDDNKIKVEEGVNDTGGYCLRAFSDGKAIAEAGDNNTGDNLTAEVYCATEPDFQNRGTATYLIGRLTNYLLSEGGYRECEYITEAENIPSIRTAEKCGYKKELEMYYFIAYPKEEEKDGI